MIPFSVRIRKERSANKTVFVWPPWWGRFYDKVDIVSYEDTDRRGEIDEYAIGLASAELVKDMIACGPEVEAIDVDAAEALVAQWHRGDASKGTRVRSVKAMIAESRGGA